MTNVITSSLLGKYLAALKEDEALIEEAAERYETAKADLEVGLQRYTAMRELVTMKLGKSPYAADILDRWPADGFDPDYEVEIRHERGKFRFTGMSAGDAILEVLSEYIEQHPRSGGWMTLANIIEALSQGGFGFPDPANARVVNAALMKITGAEKGFTNEGTAIYRYAGEGGIDPDDLPFE